MGKPSVADLCTGNGEIAAILRSHIAYAQEHPDDTLQPFLRDAETWSFSLKNAFAILINSDCPIFLVWNFDSLPGCDRILFYNDAYLSLLNETEHSIPFGQSIRHHWPEDWSPIQTDVEQVFATGQALRREHSISPRHNDPSNKRVYSWSYSALWDEAGRDETGQVGGVFATGCRVTPNGSAAQGVSLEEGQPAQLQQRQSAQVSLQQTEAALHGVAIDSTEHKRIEEMLRHREEELRLITNALPALIAYVDKDHYYRFNNQTYETWFGQPASSFTGKHVCDVLGDAAYRAILPYMKQVLSGQRISFESQIAYQAGGWRYVQADYVPNINNQGEVEGFFSLVSDISERKRAEDERRQTEEYLRASEERFRFVTQAVSGLIFDWNLHTNHVYRSEKLYDLIGIYPNDAPPEASWWHDRIHPDELARLRSQLAEVLANATHRRDLYDAEYRVRHKDGHWVDVWEQACLVRDGHGQVVRIVGCTVDISDRKHAEEALRRSEERLRVSQELSLDAFTILDCVRNETGAIADFVWTYVNPKAAEILQHSVDALVGQRLLDVLPGNRLNSELFERYVRVVETGEPHDIELFYDADGVTGWFRNMAVKQGDGIAIFFSDISDRKRSEQVLIASETLAKSRAEELTALMEIAPAAIWIARDPNCYHMTANHSAYELMRMDPGTETSATPNDGSDLLPFTICRNGQVVLPQDLPMQAAVRTGQAVTDELEFEFQDGTVQTIYGKAVPLYNSEGNIRGAISAFVDISDRKQMEEALRTSEERLRFAVEGASLGTWEYDLATSQLVWSEQAKRMFGLPLNTELDYEGFMLALHPDDRDRIHAAFEQAIAQQDTCDVEMRSLWADGSVHWMRSIGRARYDHNGAPIRVIGVVLDITDRKQAEMALAAQEQRYRHIFEAVNISIWEEDFSDVKAAIEQLKATGVQDFQQYFVEHPKFVQQMIENVHLRDVNQASLPLFEAHTKAELLNSLHQIFTPETQNAFIGELLAIAAQETHFSAETVLQTLKGDRRYIWFTITFPPASEPYDRVLVSLLDVSDRKRAEAALQQSEEQLRLAQQAAGAGVWDWDMETNRVSWSEEYYQLYGLDPAITPSYDNWLASIWEPDRVQVDLAVRDALKYRTNLNVEFRVLHPIKGLCWLTAIGQTFYSVEGYPIRMTGIALNITDRKQAEVEREQLLAREQSVKETLQRFIEHTPVAVVMLDRNMRYLFASHRWMQEYAPDYTNLKGLSHYEVMTDIPERWHQIYQRCLAGATESCEADYYRRADGTALWLHWEILPWYAGDEIGGIIIFAENITNQKQAAQERETLLVREQEARRDAEQANRIKDEFLAVLSHELRSPLNPILGWAKLLQTRQFDSAGTTRALKTIERNAKLQAQLIDDLLDVSRILRGKMVLNVCETDLATVIDAAIETVHLSAQAKSIQIHKTITGDIGLIWGDSGRLQQVVWNLLSNAVKFTPEGGTIEVKLARITGNPAWAIAETPTQPVIDQPLSAVSHYAQIQVVDTGKGITSEFLPYVFEYFRQEDGTTTRKFGGLGLGLAIVRYLTELHGGTVKAESAGEGAGATFTVTLPLKAHGNLGEQERKETDVPTPPSSRPLAGLRILVVDDEADMRELVLTILEQTGAETIIVASASKALEELENRKPNILISDIGMPEMDGYALIRQVRRLPAERGGEILAIALTAYAGEADQQQALAAGFQQHIAKPIEPEALVSAIVTLVKS